MLCVPRRHLQCLMPDEKWRMQFGKPFAERDVNVSAEEADYRGFQKSRISWGQHFCPLFQEIRYFELLRWEILILNFTNCQL